MTAFDLTRAAQADLKAIARHTHAQWSRAATKHPSMNVDAHLGVDAPHG